jgi:hypothetical protein
MPLSSLHLHSEPYGSTGNIGENFRRLLGAPTLDALQTVVRESVQNIADAAQLGSGPEIEIRIRTLTGEQVRCLKDNVLADMPVQPDSRRQLSEFLSREAPVVMEICDFGTTGLGGPTRADRIPIDAKRTDFVDFLRNIGTPRDTEHGGGTYGFGKVALYRVSRCSTILVDTLPADGSPRRLMGCHIGPSFEVPDAGMRRRFTGRHWFGVPDPVDRIADPLTGADAEQLAEALGFLPRGADQTGTSIMILDFDTEGETVEEIGRRVIETLLWNFWPRMMGDTPYSRRFRCSIVAEGTRLAMPMPEEVPPLDLFAKAMRGARSGTGNDVRLIASQRPVRQLGRLAIEKGQRSARRPIVANDSLLPLASRHIALMRPVELVVKYLEGNPLPDERLEWAGVFLVNGDDEIERAFADAEPPAHDDWIPDNLPRGHSKTFVNVALQRLKGHALDISGAGRTPSSLSGTSGPPLARVAGLLGASLESVGGDGAGRRRSAGGGGGGGSRPARARASKPVFDRLMRDENGTLAIFSTRIQQDVRQTGVNLTARASVSVEGGNAAVADELGLKPSVEYISRVGNGEVIWGSSLALDGDEGIFEIAVRMRGDCAVLVDAEVLTETAS